MAEPRRGVLFVSTVSDLAGGAERSLLELACGLAGSEWRPALAVWRAGPLPDAFREHGFDVHVYRPDGAQPGSPLGGATLRYAALGPVARLATWCWTALRPVGREVAWLRSVVEHGGFGLVHTNCDLSIPAGSNVARLASVPLVSHVRDHWRQWFHPRIASHLKRADLILVASRDMERRLRARGLESTRVDNPVFGERLARGLAAGEREQWRRRLGVVGGGLGVAVVGRLDRQKGVDLAIRAVAGLADTSVPVTLVVAGHGSPIDKQRLAEAVAASGIADRVRFLGHRTDVGEWLPALDALVMPSRGEPFGRALVEGMLAGLPVVASADGAGAELIEDGRTGLLVRTDRATDWSDTLRKLLEAPDLRDELGRTARARALERFSPAACAARVAELYTQLSTTRRRPS